MKAIPYSPRQKVPPGRVIQVPSAWWGIEKILYWLLEDFKVDRGVALEFGVEHGFSTAALANYFGEVIGVDTFAGCGHDPDTFFYEVIENLRPFPNISLLRGSWDDFTKIVHKDVDLIHIDMDHNYKQTFESGEWAVQHAPVVIFHDTLSWPDHVGKACEDLSDIYHRFYYNFEDCHGLGILTRNEL